jgi:hypothetical protein
VAALAAAALLGFAPPGALAQGDRPEVPYLGAVLTGGGIVSAVGASWSAPGLNEIVSTELLAQVPLPAGTLKNLRVFVKPTGQNGGAAVFTLRVNGADTPLTCVVGVVGPCIAPLAVAVEDGDLVVLRALNQLLQNGLPFPAFAFTYSIELE